MGSLTAWLVMPLMPEGNLQAYRPGPPTAPLGALSVLHSESFLCGAFVWVRRALNSLKRRCPARAVRARPIADEARLLEMLLQLLKASRGRPRAFFLAHPVCFARRIPGRVYRGAWQSPHRPWRRQAVVVLVGRELLHRDIKLDNVLVRRGDAGVLRETLLLTDFGTLCSFADQANGCTSPGRVCH